MRKGREYNTLSGKGHLRGGKGIHSLRGGKGIVEAGQRVRNDHGNWVGHVEDDLGP